jgi:hypothetical protein
MSNEKIDSTPVTAAHCTCSAHQKLTEPAHRWGHRILMENHWVGLICQVGQICEGLGHATNNVAEYTGLLRGLEAALACEQSG